MFHTGRAITTVPGTTILPRYVVGALGVLRKPRPDGGRIVVASNHATSWAQQVAILTADGRQVAEYWHPGWLRHMRITDLNGDGAEEIILGGVNNAYEQQGYAATLVVLDPARVFGQGPVPLGNTRRIKDVADGQESAVLLFPDIEPHTVPSLYCRVGGLMLPGDHLEVEINAGRPLDGTERRVHYQFDSHLQVTSITPMGEVVARLEELGRIRVLKNEFDNPGLPPALPAGLNK